MCSSLWLPSLNRGNFWHSLAVLKGSDGRPGTPQPCYPHSLPQGWGLADTYPCTAGSSMQTMAAFSLSLFFCLKFYQAPTHTLLHAAIQPFLEGGVEKWFPKNPVVSPLICITGSEMPSLWLDSSSESLKPARLWSHSLTAPLSTKRLIILKTRTFSREPIN